jgi:hypothetical protein
MITFKYSSPTKESVEETFKTFATFAEKYFIYAGVLGMLLPRGRKGSIVITDMDEPYVVSIERTR